jgi:hypothetical protein
VAFAGAPVSAASAAASGRITGGFAFTTADYRLE